MNCADCNNYEAKETTSKKVAFVIGHYEIDKGAYSNHLGVSEWNYWNMFYDQYLIDLGDKFIHPKNSSYTQRQSITAEKTKDYDLVFELHFNASSPQAHGVESLVYFSNDKMKKVGQFYCDEMEFKGLTNRGVKAITGGNGYGFLKATNNDAILLEPFFGSNESDCNIYNHQKHYEAIKNTINKYYSL